VGLKGFGKFFPDNWEARRISLLKIKRQPKTHLQVKKPKKAGGLIAFHLLLEAFQNLYQKALKRPFKRFQPMNHKRLDEIPKNGRPHGWKTGPEIGPFPAWKGSLAHRDFYPNWGHKCSRGKTLLGKT